MTEREKMLAGKLYTASDPELVKMQISCRKLVREYNFSEPDDRRREEMLRRLFGQCGKNPKVEPNIRCDYGCHIYVGDDFFANCDCIFLDVAEIFIGNNVMLAPNVKLFTAHHPIDAQIRNSKLEMGTPIHIGNDVWIGGGTIINPGVTIGSNVVIGSGSVVTKDIPSDSVAVGNPCRVLRKITPQERDKYID